MDDYFLFYSETMLTLIPSDDISIQKIYLELTQRCNLHCANCFRQNWTSVDTQMTQEIFDHFLMSIKDIPSLKEIILGGIGEPTIHPNFIEWVNLLPNVELRMLPVTDTGRLINIHCIFNPDFVLLK